MYLNCLPFSHADSDPVLKIGPFALTSECKRGQVVCGSTGSHYACICRGETDEQSLRAYVSRGSGWSEMMCS